MAFDALVRPTAIDNASSVAFAAEVRSHLPAGWKVAPLFVAPSITATPIALLHSLGLATAAAIPTARHPVAPLWAIIRYVDAFAKGPSLRLEDWTTRTERSHRRAVLSEDLGTAMCAHAARSLHPGSTLMDIDGYEADYGKGVVWAVGPSRPDYVSKRHGSGFNLDVWEAKGRSTDTSSAPVAKTFAHGARQTDRVVVGKSAKIHSRSVVGAEIRGTSVHFHGLAVSPPTRSRRMRPVDPSFDPSADELASLARFAGLDPTLQHRRQLRRLQIGGMAYLGTTVFVPTFGELLEVFLGLEEPLVRVARRQGRTAELSRRALAERRQRRASLEGVTSTAVDDSLTVSESQEGTLLSVRRVD